jgi:hypothetical protein
MDIRFDLASMKFLTPCATTIEASTIRAAMLLPAAGNNRELR